MLSSHNILHPAHGKPIAIPSQDMVLGSYYLTRPRKGAKGEGTQFSSYHEASLAFENNEVSPHAFVDIRLKDGWIYKTTLGRIIFNEKLPENISFINTTITKNILTDIIEQC